ncbi:hypothetical protein ACH5RR_005651 [Cinchona calisaya]|uniref:Uncharacterized protein n=1 Tax=Cinchona calisaya TaxID=153742 RepID=A0ABD3ALQ6_9GENT
MLPCLRPSPSTASTNRHASPPFSQGSVDGTPVSSFQRPPTVNLIDEYTSAVQTNSYRVIWSKVHHDCHSDEKMDIRQVEHLEEPELLEQILDPSRDCVLEAVTHIRPSALTKLAATYFNHSELTARLCLFIYQSVPCARLIYAPFDNFLDILPLDLDNGVHSLTQYHCDRAFDIFLQFDQFDNPFPSPGSYSFNDMRHCFSQLRQELDNRIHKLKSRINLLGHATRGSVTCLFAATVGVVISAVAIATHTFVALVASTLFPVCLASKVGKKELSHLAQLDAAKRGTCVLHHHLATIDSLVACLHTAFEHDKLLIRHGLERGRDRHFIQEVVKQLRRSHPNFLHKLKDLDEHLCLCLDGINGARSLLLREIQIY